MSERAEGGYARVQGWPVKGVVLRGRLWSRVAWFASRWRLPFGMFVDDLAYEPQYASYDVAHDYLSWLRRRQPPADLLYALNELCGIPSLELADDAQE